MLITHCQINYSLHMLPAEKLFLSGLTYSSVQCTFWVNCFSQIIQLSRHSSILSSVTRLERFFYCFFFNVWSCDPSQSRIIQCFCIRIWVIISLNSGCSLITLDTLVTIIRFKYNFRITPTHTRARALARELCWK